MAVLGNRAKDTSTKGRPGASANSSAASVDHKIGEGSVTVDKVGTESSLSVAMDRCDAYRDRPLSVVICAYTTRRWDDLCQSVDSVLSQEEPSLELILVIDHSEELYARACERFGADERVTVRRNTESRGLSGARNTGVGAARGKVIAFVDDDAYAEPGWAAALMNHYQDRRVAGVGGYAAPIWPGTRPHWMPEEFDWIVGCSYVGQPTRLAAVRNPIGCNMSLRRSVLDAVGGFRSEVGRIGSTPTGCEETELCLRIRSNPVCNTILFDPEIRVRHHVSPERATMRYFVSRCHQEGLSKAVVTDLADAPGALSSERTYVLRVLPQALLREVLSMSTDGFARAAVILLGLAVTTIGYVHGKARRLRAGRSCRTSLRLGPPRVFSTGIFDESQ